MLKEKLDKIYSETGAEALFTTTDYLRRYLTGFYATDGFVLADGKRTVFVTDLRYFEAAEKFLNGSGIDVVAGTVADAKRMLGDYKSVGIPFGLVSYADYLTYSEWGHELVDSLPAFRNAMIVKDETELSYIAKACEIAEEAFLALLPEIKEGMTETEVAALLEYNMRRLGASGTSFDTICAFGAHGSVPHYETGLEKLKFGDAILIDFGCKFEGYCSDITRTFLFGDDGKHGEFKKAYAQVYRAHEAVKEKVVAGMTGREADAVARNCLKEAGLDGYFTHSLGHGIGLNIHEAPTLSPKGETVLTDGMVFSDEPGVYLAGNFGIRIEDSTVMKGGKVQSFMTRTKHDLVIL